MKSIIKNILVKILGAQVRRLRLKNDFKIIGVVGSIGKTSTKLAISKALESDKRVRYQEGNYNDILSVPLVIFGQKMPTLWNIFSWVKIIIQNEFQIYSEYPFEYIVLELGTDHPGDINKFRQYLHLDIAVVTAITPEHMEYFGNIENVANEEWSAYYFADIVFANKDFCEVIPSDINKQQIIFYGKDIGAIFQLANIQKTKNGFSFEVLHKWKKVVSTSYSAVSGVELYSICAAVSVSKTLGLEDEKIEKSISQIKSLPGRMQRLKGIKNSMIIDDTYNASPNAVKMALDTLYSYPATQRIAILGMMNELGQSSKEEHIKIGNYCEPNLLDILVTIGRDANAYLAPTAKAKGCNVYTAKNSQDAGKFLSDKIKSGAVILAKGSQNGVFAEEALKPLLADPSDFSMLVRQDKEWMKKKHF